MALAQAAAAMVASPGTDMTPYVLGGVSALLATGSTVILTLWRRDIAGMERVIKLERDARVAAETECAKQSDRLDYSAKRIDAMAAEYVAISKDLAREQAKREAREEHHRDVGSSPGRLPTNPSMAAVPLPLPPPRIRSTNE